jgi:erythromycin esterase-like protein
MWRNTVVLDFAGWLRQRNDSLPERVERDKAGFYGLDLYSLYRSMHEVIAFLERIDPAAAARARERYACFDHYGEDAQSYAYAAAFGAGESCERAAVEQLQDLQRNAVEYARRDGLLAEDEVFYAEQNARAVADSEEYYRTMFGDRASSWNLRDRHMVGTLDALADHLTRQRGEESRVVVWAHNSHLGDARATELGQQGELNVGQLVREGHPGQCALIGFTTYSGTVTAADSWDGPAEVMRVRPALEGSVEHLLHGVDEPAYLVPLGPVPRPDSVLRSSLLERAIGVIYRPRTERQSHYFGVTAADQFDVLIHLDLTRALEPLERTAEWHDADVPETFPQGV